MTSPAPRTIPATPEAPDRFVWADAVKGVCIVLVVLHHLVSKHYDLAMRGDGAAGALVSGWLGLTDVLEPVRMPLFFVISGMFAASSVRRPWRRLTRRVLAPYYLYVVWLLIHAAVFSVATTLPMNRTRTLPELLGDLVLASTQLWYLYALAAYLVVAKVLLRLGPPWVVLAGAAALSASASLLPVEAANRESLLQHFVFFLAGVLGPTLVRRVAEARTRHLTAGLGACFVAVTLATGVLGLPQSATTILVGLVGVPFAIRLVTSACRDARFGRAAAALGRRTLGVYVLHVPVLALLHHLAAPVIETSSTVPSMLLLAVYPLVATALVTATSLALQAAVVRAGGRALFTLPGTNSVRGIDSAPRVTLPA